MNIALLHNYFTTEESAQVRGDASGQTAAHWAAAGGHTAALDALLSARPASLLQADGR